MFAETKKKKKIVCLDKFSLPPSKRIMVRPLALFSVRGGIVICIFSGRLKSWIVWIGVLNRIILLLGNINTVLQCKFDILKYHSLTCNLYFFETPYSPGGLQGRIQKFDKGGKLWFLEQANSKYWSNQDLSGIFEY